MTKKKDKNSLDEYRKIKNEMIVDKVNEIFRKHPDNYIQKLEEDKATPQNDRQKYLVAYFDGGHENWQAVILRSLYNSHFCPILVIARSKATRPRRGFASLAMTILGLCKGLISHL